MERPTKLRTHLVHIVPHDHPLPLPSQPPRLLLRPPPHPRLKIVPPLKRPRPARAPQQPGRRVGGYQRGLDGERPAATHGISKYHPTQIALLLPPGDEQQAGGGGLVQRRLVDGCVTPVTAAVQGAAADVAVEVEGVVEQRGVQGQVGVAVGGWGRADAPGRRQWLMVRLGGR